MIPTLRAVTQPLVDERLVSLEALDASVSQLDERERTVFSRPLPWYARALTGACAWVASLLFFAFVAELGVVEVAMYTELGAALIALAIVVRWLPLPFADFWHQLALCASLTGRPLLVVGLAGLGAHDLAAVMLGVEVVLVVASRDRVQQFVATLAACGYALALVADRVGADDAVVLGAAVLAGLGLVRRWPYAGAWYALVVFVLGAQVWSTVDWAPRGTDVLSLDVACTAGLGILELGLVAWLLAEGRARPAPAVIALLGTLAILLFTRDVPGLGVALGFGLVAFRAREPLLLALATAFVVGFGVWFEYDLALTLWAKSGAMIGTGAILLALGAHARSLPSDPEPP